MATEYILAFPAYEGHKPFIVLGMRGEEVESRTEFDTRAAAEFYLAEMNDTAEWREYCREAVDDPVEE